MQTSIRLLSALSFAALLASCSFTPQAPEPSEIPLRDVDLYYNRASMNDISYEQFKLSGTTLLAECGSLSGGRHSAKEHKVVSIDAATLDTAKAQAWAVRRYVDELNANFKAPGGVSNMFDSGKLSMKLTFENGTTAISTSFDSIAGGTADKEAAVGRLARTIRKAAGGTLCGQQDFYGLGMPESILKTGSQ